jgi:dTDP-4-amino-4,6-dideoxygalactose transaminase
MKVPFFDLGRQTERLREELGKALMEVIDSNRFILGPHVRRFESEIESLLRVKHAIGVGSGSDALLLALLAADLEPDSEVIVPAFSFFATASAVLRAGLRIVFADIDLGTFQIDPARVLERITPRTRAVIAAHLFGDCADISFLRQIASDHSLLLVEDAAQAFGASHADSLAGTMGSFGCFSFYPTKNLAGIGDGGMVVTDDPRAARRLRLLRAQGDEGAYDHSLAGINSRLDSLQAAALSVRLKYVSEWNRRRREIAGLYSEGLSGSVVTPAPAPGNRSVFNQYVIRSARRDRLRAHLSRRGIGTAVYYPTPLHLQKGLAPFCGSPGDHPCAEEAARTCLALPVFPELTESEVDYVIENVRGFAEPSTARP